LVAVHDNMEENIVEVNNLNFKFGKNLILSGISMSISKGDFLGIIGPNGSGKTTLVKVLLGIYASGSGAVKMFGKDVKSFSDWKKIGYIPQKATNIDQNFPATVREIVSMGLISRKKIPRIMDKKDSQDIMDALKLVGMEKFIDRQIGQLSGGQQQKVFIAKAMISKPEILFLDEPTTGVDHESQHIFYDMLNDLNKNHGITIVLISHDVGSITQYVNKVACLNQKLVFHGTHKEFCSSDMAHDFLTKENHYISHSH